MKKLSQEKEKKATLDAYRDEVFRTPYGGGNDDDDDDDDMDIARRESLRTGAKDEHRRQMNSRSQSVREAGESSGSKSGGGLFERFRNVFSASGRKRTKRSTPASCINLEEEETQFTVPQTMIGDEQLFRRSEAKQKKLKHMWNKNIVDNLGKAAAKYDNTYEEADEIRVGSKNVIKRLESNIDRQINAINEIQIYELGMGSFGEPIAKAAIRKEKEIAAVNNEEENYPTPNLNIGRQRPQQARQEPIIDVEEGSTSRSATHTDHENENGSESSDDDDDDDDDSGSGPQPGSGVGDTSETVVPSTYPYASQSQAPTSTSRDCGKNLIIEGEEEEEEEEEEGDLPIMDSFERRSP
ncbi:hypothetical protein ACLOJK_036260 [Asimina triloba]